MAKQVAKTYGEALFELSLEEKKADVLLEEAAGIRGILKDNPEFDKLLKHPRISREEKLEVARTVFGQQVSREMMGFLELVIQKERYQELEAIFLYFEDRVREERRIGVAKVTTAIELSDGKKAEVLEKLLHTTAYESFEMQYEVDPSLIGGMIIRIGDRVVDSSIRQKLAEIKKDLLQIQLG